MKRNIFKVLYTFYNLQYILIIEEIYSCIFILIRKKKESFQRIEDCLVMYSNRKLCFALISMFSTTYNELN